MDSIQGLTAVNVLDDTIVNAINTIRENKKQADETSINEFFNKSLENAKLTKVTLNESLTFRLKNNHITNKLTYGENSYFVNNNGLIEPKKDMGKQLLTDAETPPPKKKNLIAGISDKLENLQNFFIHEISDVRTKLKNVMRIKIPVLTEKKRSNNIDLFKKQIHFLKTNAKKKYLIINILLEQLLNCT